MGVKITHSDSGSTTGPPAESEYAVEPAGVAKMKAVRAEFIKLGTVDGKAEIVNSGLCTGDDRVV